MLEKEYLDIAIKASAEGARKILEVYRKDFEVEFKRDNSPLTLADQWAHEAISTILARTNLPILSEEGKHLPFEIRKQWKRFWLVDPLDGTKEFVKRNGEFTVNIALIEDTIPILGVVLVPVTGKIYYAASGSGAYTSTLKDFVKIEESLAESSPVPDKNQASRPYRVVCSRSHLSTETESYIESIRPDHPDLEFISVGSSLKLCLIAEGKADLYPRFGPTMEWDTAAGQALVEISGGFVNAYPENEPLRYNKESLLNPWFISGRK